MLLWLPLVPLVLSSTARATSATAGDNEMAVKRDTPSLNAHLCNMLL